jgi:hypothetical protein
MASGSDHYQVEAYPLTMSQKSLRRFGSMLGNYPSLTHLTDVVAKARSIT